MTSNIHERPGFIHGINGLVAEWYQVTVADFDLEYIACALANINRYAGRSLSQWPKHISVARHSIEVVKELERRGVTDNEVLLAGLFHDASEAFVGDMQSYVKKEIRGAGCKVYDRMEAFFTMLICEKFYVRDHREFPIIKEVDLALLKPEREFLYGDVASETYAPGGELYTPSADFWDFIQEYSRLRHL